MTDVSTQSIVIAAPPARVAEVICDFARYPEWVDAVKSVEILEQHADGSASQVRFVLDAGVLVDEYVLCYEFSADKSRIAWELAKPSRVMKAQHGSYDIAATEDGAGAVVTYSLAIDLAISMIGMLRRKAEKVITDTALRELKRRVEGQDA